MFPGLSDKDRGHNERQIGFTSICFASSSPCYDFPALSSAFLRYRTSPQVYLSAQPDHTRPMFPLEIEEGWKKIPVCWRHLIKSRGHRGEVVSRLPVSKNKTEIWLLFCNLPYFICYFRWLHATHLHSMMYAVYTVNVGWLYDEVLQSTRILV